MSEIILIRHTDILGLDTDTVSGARKSAVVTNLTKYNIFDYDDTLPQLDISQE